MNDLTLAEFLRYSLVVWRTRFIEAGCSFGNLFKLRHNYG